MGAFPPKLKAPFFNLPRKEIKKYSAGSRKIASIDSHKPDWIGIERTGKKAN